MPQNAQRTGILHVQIAQKAHDWFSVFCGL